MPEKLKLTYGGAVNAALARCLEQYPETILYGEDVALPGGVFGVTRGLQKAFGERVFDTPISETAMLGAAVGAAMMGRRPIVEIMWIDFAWWPSTRSSIRPRTCVMCPRAGSPLR